MRPNNAITWPACTLPMNCSPNLYELSAQPEHNRWCAANALLPPALTGFTIQGSGVSCSRSWRLLPGVSVRHAEAATVAPGGPGFTWRGPI
jgi:hypothetical protein